MSYFADSAWSCLEKKIRRIRLQASGAEARKLMVMVPALGEDALLDLAETLTNRCGADATLELLLKIAQVVTDVWSSAGLSKAEAHDWLDGRGNLTYYRNLPPLPGRLRLVVLCGADRVTDAGGLEDFDRCDLDTVWQEEMKCSFRTWARARLQAIGITDVESAELREFDRLMKPLLDQGRADLLQLGTWLERMDLSSANTVREVLLIMLGQYGAFQLPKFTGFPLGRRTSLAPYIERANNFFSYSLFLDSRERDKATRATDQLLQAIANGDEIGFSVDREDVRGPYATGRAFLEGLRNYIQTEDRHDRERLRDCDFVTIMDKVLKFRKRDGRATPDPLRKLSGSPIEVILQSVWQAFRDFGRDRRFTHARVQRVEITAIRFKHDYEHDSDEAIDRNELARQYLARLLGGVDGLVSSRLTLADENEETLPVACKLADEEIACVYSRTAEPQLEFSVDLIYDADGDPYRRRFAWRLPEIQSYRLAEGLLHWARNAFATDGSTWKLPVFHLPYYEELLRATDDEETRRVLLHCIRDDRQDDSQWTNLLGHGWLASHDVLLQPLKALAARYTRFVQAAYERGLHAALFGAEWMDLRQAYTAACSPVVEDAEAAQSQMAAMLMRMFLVVQKRGAGLGAAWQTEPFERSGVATVLHPAVLEMLEAQVIFLFSCFNAAAGAELQREDRRKAFAGKTWSGYVDLASIQTPIAGLLYNADLNLDTNIRGQELVHRVGSPEDREATLSTRLLTRYDDVSDDEDVTDAEMLRETRESKLLFRLMLDYFRLHPHARDGLALAVFRNQDIQPVIAAVHQYLSKLADEKDHRYYVLSPERRKPYAISVTILTGSGDDVDVARWIEQWRERWEAAETEDKFEVYRRCRFSVAHRIVDAQRPGSFQRLVNDSFEADIAVLYNFIGAGQGGNRFQEVTPFDITTRTLKFPILEKPCCAVRHPIDGFKRSRVISNLQFSLGKLHTQVMHRLKNQGVQPGREFVVLGYGDFAPWHNVVDALHAKAEWVICIDPSMDERLIRIPAGERAQEREIIGFGSGVGSHGEANYTVSTEQFSLADVRVRLADSIQGVYSQSGWTVADCQEMAGNLLREAREISGLSLVRATGVGHYIREFMAYSLTRKMLREKREVLCDHLVSLDAYRHWFDLADNESRPDLVWLTAWLDENKRVCLELRLIECKVAQEAEEHLLRARAQITNGLRVLVPAFAPRPQGDAAPVEDSRPDQRYWWLQLHRLVASKAEIDNRQMADVLSALERLAEGDYDITWGAAVLAFWSNNQAAEAKRIGRWTVGEESGVTAGIYEMGSELVRRLALEDAGFPVTWDEWERQAQQEPTNICDDLADIELASGDDDEDDTPPWDDQEEREDGEDREAAADEGLTPQDVGSGVDADSVEAAPIQGCQATVSEAGQEREAGLVPVPAPPIPARLLLGTTVSGGRPVYWEFGHPGLANRHMLLFGASGTGKTYAIQCLLCEMGRQGQNSLILDYTDGFTGEKLEPQTVEHLRPEQHYVYNNPLPIDPFKMQMTRQDGMDFVDRPYDVAKRVASIFKSVYALGDQQFSVLTDAIADGLESGSEAMTLPSLLTALQGYIGDALHTANTVRSTANKIKPFVLGNPFASGCSDMGWPGLFSDTKQRCHIFQFYHVDRTSARAIIEFVLWDLYSFVCGSGTKDVPRVVVLDEVQNLDLGQDAPVAKYLTEGRKHGLALITATQTVRGVGGVSDARVSRLFLAAHKLFFRPTENEMREHAQLLYNAVSSASVAEWVQRLASLQKGECWSLGPSLNEATERVVVQAQRIKITSLETRGLNG